MWHGTESQMKAILAEQNKAALRLFQRNIALSSIEELCSTIMHLTKAPLFYWGGGGNSLIHQGKTC